MYTQWEGHSPIGVKSNVSRNQFKITTSVKGYKFIAALLFLLLFVIPMRNYTSFHTIIKSLMGIISFNIVTYFIYKAIIEGNLKGPYYSSYRSNDKFQRRNKKRKGPQKNLQQKEVILQKVLNSLEEGIIVINENYEIIHYNDKYMEMFQIPRKLLENKNYKKINQYIAKLLIEPEEFIEYVEKVYSSYGDFSKEFNLKDGRTILRYTSPFEAYNMKGWVVSARDITQERVDKELRETIGERERRLEENQKQTQFTLDFYTNFSHELKTPINIISAVGHILKNEIGNDLPKCQEYLDILNQNCNRLIRNINNSIDLNKMEVGYFQLSPQDCNIVEIIEDITLSVVPYTEEKNIDLIFDTDVEEMITKVDITAMERILLNLLSNAIKFTEPGGKIQVIMKESGKELEISVVDTGIGIGKDKLEYIFERFHQEDRSLEYNPRGSGIGLYLVKRLVEMQGGRILVHSKVEEGSVFQVILPIIEVSPQEEIIDYQSLSMHKLGYREVTNIELSDVSLNKNVSVR